MADNVRFLCDNGIGGVGYSGCNGFPFAYSSASPGTLNPEIVSFLDCVKWWWRVKNWHLSTDCAIVDTLGNAYALPSEDLNPVPGSPTKELNLIDPAAIHNWLNTTSSPNYNFNFALMGGRIILSGTDLYPDVQMAGQVNTNAAGATGAMLIRFDNPGGGAPSFDATIDGITFPCYYDVTSDPPMSFIASQLDLTPAEYWPYAALNGGGAIYDTSSGDQLLPPTS